LDRPLDVCHEEEGGEGRQLGRLDDDGASGEEGGGHFACEHEEGEVPGADADGLTSQMNPYQR